MEVAGLCGLCGKPAKKLYTCKLCGRIVCGRCIELDVCGACSRKVPAVE
jgi:hypothetical protein